MKNTLRQLKFILTAYSNRRRSALRSVPRQMKKNGSFYKFEEIFIAHKSYFFHILYSKHFLRTNNFTEIWKREEQQHGAHKESDKEAAATQKN